MITRLFAVGAIIGLAAYVCVHPLPFQADQADEQLASISGGLCFVDATTDCLPAFDSFCKNEFCGKTQAATCPKEGVKYQRKKQPGFENAAQGGPGRDSKKVLPQISCAIESTCSGCEWWWFGLSYYCKATDDQDKEPRIPEKKDDDAKACAEP